MTTPPPSELFDLSPQFRSFFESLGHLNPRFSPDLDTEALLSLSGEERERAEGLLIERIETTGEPVIEALVEMKSRRGAEALHRYVPRARGSHAVAVALALWKMERWPKAQNILIKVLKGKLGYIRNDWSARAEAARALAHIPDTKTKQALYDALNDEDDHVRHWVNIALNVVLRAESAASQ